MKNRATSDNSSAVNLFPFLAVLLCTMGALLVLLVVVAQRAGQQAVSDESPAETVASAIDPAVTAEAEKLQQQLAEVHAYQKKIRDLHQQSSSRLQDEQQRLTHLEEHGRRLEEELAKLFLASEQLKATENNLVVDQQRAERERQHLEQRIEEAKATLDEMRKAAPAKKSYAIVPYKGPNGTFRRPIFIECSAKGVILQPEGIRLEQKDFARPLGPGNPLAAALRAAREHLDGQAAQRGENNLPDPYPMLVVRPDGILQYSAARRAIASWDADFGYVFVDQDLPLEFGPIDPTLAKAEYHAVLQSRDMRRSLVRAAPSRYRGHGAGGGGIQSAARRGSQGSGGTGLSGPGGDSNRYGTFSENGNTENGNSGSKFAGTDGGGFGDGSSGDDNSGDGGSFGSDGSGDGGSGDGGSGGDGSPYGSSGDDGQETYASNGGGQQSGKAGESGGANEPSDAGSQFAEGDSESGGSEPGASGGGSSSYASSGNSGASSSAAGGSAGESPQSGNASAALDFTKNRQTHQSIAQAQGTDWAVRRSSLTSVPMRRPIRVIVRKDRLAILPERRKGVDAAEGGSVILLNQSLKDISGELVAALRERIDDWGMAGNGLYWRPVLVFNVGPDAKQTADRLVVLLKNSGVEIQTSETARNPRGGHDHATR